jgi:HTH-type transcriptional regulator / antitoxin HigA
MISVSDYRSPGQLLSALLSDKGWTQRVLAIVLGMDETGVNKIVADKRSISAELALSLEELFGIAAGDILALQKDFELARARIVARPDPKRAIRAKLFGGLPVSEMIKRGWLNVDDVRDLPVVERELAGFFSVASVEEIEILPHAAKKTVVSAETTPVQLAWLYRVKQIASEMIVARYSKQKLESALEALKKTQIAPEETRKVPRVLAEAGVRFLIVEALPGSKIDGVCFWLDDISPVIGMSLRFDRIDNFWFVLRHEIEHVLQEHGKQKIAIDTEMRGEKSSEGIDLSDDERIANEAASEFCVPKKSMDAFIARKFPLFTDRDIRGFAATLKIHPGIAVGQLQYRINKYTIFKEHLAKVRTHITPSAVVDGWGDIAQVGL